VRISIDIDSTLSDDFIKTWVENYNILYEDNLDYTTIVTWDIASYFTKCNKQQCFEFLTPHFFLSLKPRHDAVYLIDTLKSLGHEVFLVTAYHRDSIRAKIQWVTEHFNLTENDIIPCNNKYRVDCDVLIDDGSHNLQGFEDRNIDIVPILMTQPHNLKCSLSKYYRIHELSEAIDIINRVEGCTKIKKILNNIK